jgi:hypothetical protein
MHVERGQVLVSGLKLTVTTSRGIIWIVKITSQSLYEVACPIVAGLTRRRIEHVELITLTSDDQTTDDRYVRYAVKEEKITHVNSVDTMAERVRVYGLTWYSHLHA